MHVSRAAVLILLLANHDPESESLKNELCALNEWRKENPPNGFEIKFAVTNFLGYGLYKESIYDFDTFRSKFEKQIFSK
jgi:hypothetical protein